jgi:ATP-dependent protease ClpP protease subunit
LAEYALHHLREWKAQLGEYHQRQVEIHRVSKYLIDWEVDVKMEDSEYVDLLMDCGVDLQTSQIYLTSSDSLASSHTHEPGDIGVSEPGIEYSMVNQFIMNMNLLMRVQPHHPILIHMKVAGGFWEEGMAIYDMIKSCPNPTTILSYTHARSMSSLILQAANKRVLMPNSYFMAHDGTLAFSGTSKSGKSYVKFTERMDDTMKDIYVHAMRGVENGGASDSENWAWLRSLMDKREEVYFTAQEAVEYGFADEVFGANDEYNWRDLTKYTKEQLER